jgi:outer membrane protein assembly factor BamB
MPLQKFSSFRFTLAVAICAASLVACKKSTSLDPNEAALARRAPIKKKWEFNLGSRADGALALSDDGTIIAACQDGFVYAVDSNGKLQWKTYIGATHASPSIGQDGAIYIANDNGTVFALNRSGSQRWQSLVYEGNTYGHNAAAINSSFLFTPSRDGLKAVNLADGKVEWAASLGTEQWGAVTLLADGMLLFGSRGRLTAVSSQGDPYWQYPPLTDEALKRNGGFPPPGNFAVSSGITPGPDHILLVGVGWNELAAVGMDGALRWKLDSRGTTLNTASPVVASDGTIYFAHSNGHLYALDSLGNKKWDLDTVGAISVTPLLASDGTIFLMANRFLYAVTPDGKVIAQADVAGVTSPPTVAPDGTIYLANASGMLAAYEGGHGGLMDSPWPKYQGDLANSGVERGAN